jgi:hypothetical protein
MTREIMASVGVGPVKVIAEAILESPSLIAKGDLVDMIQELLPRLGWPREWETKNGIVEGWTPNEAALDKLKAVLIGVLPTGNPPLTFQEHELWERDIDSPSMSRLLESTSKNPKTGILYAYGIDPDSHVGSGQIRFVRGLPNTNAFVSVMLRRKESELATPYSINFSNAVFSIEECKSRILRDQEVLVPEVERVLHCVALPDFDVTDPIGSLDRAAENLIMPSWAKR